MRPRHTFVTSAALSALLAALITRTVAAIAAGLLRLKVNYTEEYCKRMSNSSHLSLFLALCNTPMYDGA